MPRIEIIPENWETSEKKADGDGTPTIDVCKSCAIDFVEGQAIETQVLSALYGEGNDFGDKDVVGSTEVDHPTFGEEKYDCACCGERLTAKDD